VAPPHDAPNFSIRSCPTVVEVVPRKQKRKASTPKTQAHPWPPSRARLEELIAEAILDAYG